MTAGPVKRVTLWVRDAERSLAVYRDALGLSVLEDKRLAGEGIARMVGLQHAALRIIHLGVPGATHGWIGLYEISDTKPIAMTTLAPPPRFPCYGQATVLISTDAMSQILPRLRATAGVRFVTGPTEYLKTTASGATPAGRYSEVIFFDPDNISVGMMGYAPL